MNLGEQTYTNRGFPVVEFRDDYGIQCSIQNSSNAERECIWLGVNDANPQILASQAHKFGVRTTETTGWVPFPVPEEVLMTTRMHLNREQVELLVKHLRYWLKNGEPGL